MTRNQTSRLLDLLRSQGEEGVGFYEALDIVGTSRLAARIKDLRDAGHDIETQWETTPTKKRVARYCLHPEMRLGL
jgi:Helix-turn-helix domain